MGSTAPVDQAFAARPARAPNTHQPFVAFRLRFRAGDGSMAGNNDLGRILGQVDRAETWTGGGDPAEAARAREEFDDRVEQATGGRLGGEPVGLPGNFDHAGPWVPNLGIGYEPIPYANGTFGARVNRPPAPNSAAAQLGLEPGDIVFALDGQRFQSHDDVVNHTQRTTIDFIDVRTGQARSAVITLP